MLKTTKWLSPQILVKALLNSDDYGDRLRAVNQFRELDNDAAFELAQLAANDDNPGSVTPPSASYRALPTAIQPLWKRSSSGHSLTILKLDVQAAAADAIGGLQLRGIYDDLAAVYHSSDEWLVQFSIVAALGELGEPNAFPLLAGSAQLRQRTHCHSRHWGFGRVTG